MWSARVHEELVDLYEKSDRLSRFISSDHRYAELGETQRFLLKEQLLTMVRYAEILESRLKLEPAPEVVQDFPAADRGVPAIKAAFDALYASRAALIESFLADTLREAGIDPAAGSKDWVIYDCIDMMAVVVGDRVLAVGSVSIEWDGLRGRAVRRDGSDEDVRRMQAFIDDVVANDRARVASAASAGQESVG